MIGAGLLVRSSFFDLMKIKLLAGRRLLSSDGRNASGVAVVNDTFARRFFPGQSALGRRIRFPENPYRAGDVGFQLAHRTVDELEIVGSVDDVKYLALGEPPEPSIYMSCDQFTNRRQTILVKTTVVFGLMAMALAAVGVYGLMSYSVTQRTGEMAVRSAMGASARQVLALVMGWGGARRRQ